VLGDAGTGKASVEDCPTVVDRDHLDGSGGAVTKYVCGRSVSVSDCSNRSLRSLGAHPGQVIRVVICLDDEPPGAREISGAAQGGPVFSVEDVVDEEFEIESAERQHWQCSFVLRRGVVLSRWQVTVFPLRPGGRAAGTARPWQLR